ncbi:hypothetical protein D9M71_846910 [compost metagenome]
MLKPKRPRRATAAPMLPMPTMPRVLPCTSLPKWAGPTVACQLPALVQASSSAVRRAQPMISEKPRSAVLSVSTSGVLVRAMPRWLK